MTGNDPFESGGSVQEKLQKTAERRAAHERQEIEPRNIKNAMGFTRWLLIIMHRLFTNNVGQFDDVCVDIVQDVVKQKTAHWFIQNPVDGTDATYRFTVPPGLYLEVNTITQQIKSGAAVGIPRLNAAGGTEITAGDILEPGDIIFMEISGSSSPLNLSIQINFNPVWPDNDAA